MAQDISALADSQVFILKALATYRFLTVKQLLKLDYQISRNQLYAKLKPMREEAKPLVKTIDFGSVPGEGRLDAIYCLSTHGAKLVRDLGLAEKDISFPKRVTTFKNDYHHRISCVDFHISLNAFANEIGANVDFFDTYYSDGKKRGRTGVPRTSFEIDEKPIVPDAIFSFTTPDGVRRLCCFEQHNGEDATRLIKQLISYSPYLYSRTIEQAYSYPHSARVLIVFESQKCLEKVQAAFSKSTELAPFAKHYFLKTNGDITNKPFKDEWLGFRAFEARALY
ncbi:MAG: replication-relaxation family protein [Methylocystaceae bacterium]|nr:replication-relaxation family protein [Methylocystaceae bacterium]